MEGDGADLPYGGDLDAAMREQDRGAVRALLAARKVRPSECGRVSEYSEAHTGFARLFFQDDISSLEKSAGAETRGIERLACPICRDLLHKPVVAPCSRASRAVKRAFLGEMQATSREEARDDVESQRVGGCRARVENTLPLFFQRALRDPVTRAATRSASGACTKR